MAATVMIVGKGREYSLHEKEKGAPSWFEATRNFCGKGEAPFRIGQLVDKSVKLGSELFESVRSNAALQQTRKTFQAMWLPTIVFRIPDALKTTKELVASFKTPSEGETVTRKRCIEQISDATESVATFGYSASLLLAPFTEKVGNAFLKVADFVTFIGDTVQVRIQTESVMKIGKEIEQVGQLDRAENVDQLHNHLVDTKRFHMLKAAKSILSVAGFVLGLVLAASGTPGLVVVAAGISFVSTILAISASLKEEKMAYTRFKPDVDVKLTVV